LATASTLLGSLLSLALAGALIQAFSGKGIIPTELIDAPLLASVALAAALTVLIATRLGFPVSTTHALVGGIAGAGLVAAGGSLEFLALMRAFILPLLVGPILAIGVAYAGFRLAHWIAYTLGLKSTSCICIAQVQTPVACPLHPLGATASEGSNSLKPYGIASSVRFSAGTQPGCRNEFADRVVAISADKTLTLGHLLSAGLVGFARGLNDTPKIVGLFVGLGMTSALQGTIAIAAMMAIGGWVAARRVAETLSKKITPMTPSQGLVANISTAALVVAASRFGLPVSTTHVSTGAIFGIGSGKGSLDRRMVTQILAAWIVTLPLATCFAAALMWCQPWI
jgi:PiT family inorganic phosphate transporter